MVSENWFSRKTYFYTIGSSTVIIVDGEKMDFNNMIGLDFPDIEGSVTMVGKFGQFGAPKKEISEVEVLWLHFLMDSELQKGWKSDSVLNPGLKS